MGLAVDEVGEFEQAVVASDVIKPIDHLQVVAATTLSPETPVAEVVLGQLLQLIAEVAGEEGDDTLVARCHVVLLHDLQHHHARPPVLGIVAL